MKAHDVNHVNYLKAIVAIKEFLAILSNLGALVELVLAANRELAEKSLTGEAVVREPFLLTGT